MPYASVIEGVSGLVTRSRKSSTANPSTARSGNSSKKPTANTSKTSAAPTSVTQSTVKRCTICPVPHNSSTAHERRLGLIRKPGSPSLFNRLAPELRALLYRHIAATDVLRLRLTCRSLLNLVEMDIGEIIRCLVMEDSMLRTAHSLAKDGINTPTPTVGYLVALSHRCHVAEALGRFLAKFHLQEIYACKSSAALARSPHAHKVRFMVDNLKPYLIIVSHMLEVYRSSVARIVQGKSAVEEMRLQACRSECEIMRQYTSNDRLSLVFEIVKKTLFRQLRPASYATFLERRIRGWTEPSANDDKVMSLIVFGGIDAIYQVIAKPTYNLRIRALEDWLFKTGGSELPRAKPDTLTHRSINHGLGPATIQRMKAILPDRSHFFNKWARIDSRGQRDPTLEIRPLAFPKPDTGEFQLWLRTDHVESDFELWRSKAGINLLRAG
ncbi:MAG: hypothetical protein L6R38_004244 [Xanthoria sp. 2 TBL-2021]|nr:MAG: hypothetical protein L6R38_004244 [Xanthoria sp. 2 TBL-2021]